LRTDAALNHFEPIRSQPLSPDTTMLPISVPLDQIAGAGAGSRADHGAFLPANQSTPDRAGDSADNRALGLTVVMPVRTPMRKALRGGTEEYKHE